MLKRELPAFLVVGLLTVLLDFLTYRSIIWIGLFGADLAKATGFLIGTLFAYFSNRFWTFGHKPHAPGSQWRFALLYTATLGANVFVNSRALLIFGGTATVIQTAFLLATGVSACLNFLGMKMFVFKIRSLPETL